MKQRSLLSCQSEKCRHHVGICEERRVDWRKDTLEVSRKGCLYAFFNEAGNYHVAHGSKYEVGFHDSSKLPLDVVSICMIFLL